MRVFSCMQLPLRGQDIPSWRTRTGLDGGLCSTTGPLPRSFSVSQIKADDIPVLSWARRDHDEVGVSRRLRLLIE